MAIKVVLSNASQVTRRTPDVQETSTVKVSRATYQKLGSLLKNKTLLTQYENGELVGEYKRVLDELNNLFLKVNYPAIGADLVIAPGILELDEWLGDLGIVQDYPYDKDSVNISAWVEVDTPDPIRVLVDLSDNTYLVDTSDDTVLVSYENTTQIRNRRA